MHRRAALAWQRRTAFALHNLLTEAEKRAGLTALLQVVLEEYQTNPDVVRVVEAYGVTSRQPPTTAENRATTIYNVNTGGGPYVAGNVTTGGDFVGRDSSKLGGSAE